MKNTLVLLGLLATFLLSNGRQAVSQTATLETLHLAASPVDDVMPVLYAQRAGLFRRAGLDIVLDRANNGSAVAAAVTGGAVDIGKGNIVPIITAHAHGVPLIIVAPGAIWVPATPDAALLVSTTSSIRSARDLVGKVIGTATLNDLLTLATQAWLDANHVDWHTVQFVEFPFPAMGTALDQDRVQAILQVKPFVTDGVDSGKARILAKVSSVISDRFLESAWFVTPDFLAKHRNAVVQFQRVVAQASAYTNTHQGETVDLLATWSGISPDRATRVPRIVTGTALAANEIQPVIDLAAKYQLIKDKFDAREIMLP